MSDSMSETTQPDEAALRALAEQATPLPWRLGTPAARCKLPHAPHGRGQCLYTFDGWTDDACSISRVVDYGPDDVVVDEGLIAGMWDYEEGGVVHTADARYIVAACNAMPGILTTLADLCARLAAVTAERDEWMASSAGYGSDMVEWKVRAQSAETALAAVTAERDAAIEAYNKTAADANVLERERLAFRRSAEAAEQQRDTARAEADMYKQRYIAFSQALGSIARSACCGGCQEAALVARAAMSAPESATKPEVVYYASRWASETEDGGWGVACSRKVQGGRAGGIVKDAPDEATARRWAAEMNAALSAPEGRCPAGQEGACATCDDKPDPSTCDHDVSCSKCGTRWHTAAEIPTALQSICAEDAPICPYCNDTGIDGARASDGAPLVCTACQGPDGPKVRR